MSCVPDTLFQRMTHILALMHVFIYFCSQSKGSSGNSETINTPRLIILFLFLMQFSVKRRLSPISVKLVFLRACETTLETNAVAVGGRFTLGERALFMLCRKKCTPFYEQGFAEMCRNGDSKKTLAQVTTQTSFSFRLRDCRKRIIKLEG